MKESSQSNRLHIAIFGRKNAGKSSLLNALSNQNAALVADSPGTTVEPQYVHLDLEPLGPVVLIDTVGFEENDRSETGELRGRKLREVMDHTDVALLLFTDTNEDYALEQRWYRELVSRHIPVMGVVNRIDDRFVDIQPIKVQFDEIPIVKISAKNKVNLNRLKESLRRSAPFEFERSTIVGDLIEPNELIVIVSPKGLKAPRYRLPMIHTQLIRDIMDHGAVSVTVTEDELPAFLTVLNRRPDMVVTESDIFEQVSGIIPQDVPLTTFSILLARFKGELDVFVRGAKAIDGLKPGDKVLVAEACSNHDMKGDLTREELPRWLEERAGGKLEFVVRTGCDFPVDLSSYRMIVHCGSCSFNRKQMMARLSKSQAQKVPITNYGIAMAYIQGLLERAIPPVAY
ncbi:[FeFe] hydrogenase H-cluster maturation GTPase HydF [Gorillibacterium sp. sgz5001074]|uniref:[FeFe] hydrogenase H-cluster maturation GTPase HydF n=1 Tax=Gorillibacterium sp. sgz5001074 TaxID=3446695 RepID=UPI003F66D875